MRDETRSQDGRSFEFPEGVKRHWLRDCGLAVTLPKRFLSLPATFDRLAQRLEQTGIGSVWPNGSLRAHLRQSFYDPAVYRISHGVFCPMRTVEFAVWHWAEPEDDVRRSMLAFSGLVPRALAQLELPGYLLIGKEDTLIGGSPALRCEYLWDGPGERVCGGDHAVAIALPLPDRVAFILHHSPGDHWAAWLDGLDDILASLSVIDLAGSPE